MKSIEPRALIVIVIVIAVVLAAAWGGRFAGFW
jgi:hypothetical protein